ncbi:MAG: hypothetical protein ACRCZY_07520 [Phocaeicola sp.]
MFKLIKSTLLVLSGVLAMSSCSKDNVVDPPVKEYSVNFNSSDTEMGTVNPEGENKGTDGSIIESTAIPKENCTFVEWLVDDKPVETGDDITVSGNTLKVKLTAATSGKTYKASFATNFRFAINVKPDNLNYSLPFKKIGATGGYELTVDWGDGTKLDSILPGTSLVDGISHAYAAGDYTIAITSSEKDYTKEQMPEVTYSDDTFLTSINTPLLKTVATGFPDLFYNCSSLTSIPEGLFKYNTAATNFNELFFGCSSLTSIPKGLFKYNTAATDFNDVFNGCSSLSSIPAELFKDNTAATNFSQVFYGCSSLTEIPAGLFEYNKVAINFRRAFYGCIKAQVNPNIFCNDSDENEKATRFNSLTGEISFERAFFKVGEELSSEEEISESIFPALWDYAYSAATVTKTSCFSGAKAKNAGEVKSEWK